MLETTTTVVISVEGLLGFGHDAEDVVNKNDASSPREGTASAVREAARSGVPERGTSPERPKRRTFTAEYKLRILEEVDETLASGGEDTVGAASSRGPVLLTPDVVAARARAGELVGLTPKKRGRKATKNSLADEVARLRRENAKANTVFDVQRKVAALLGEPVPESTEEEIVLGQGSVPDRALGHQERKGVVMQGVLFLVPLVGVVALAEVRHARTKLP